MEFPCAQCAAPLAGLDPATEWRCYVCGSRNRIRVFPAMLHTAIARPAEAALEGEASCFDHPTKRAAAICGQCGRYVCSLCRVDFGHEVLCPSCVTAGSGRAHAVKLEPARKLYDSMALLFSVLPLVLWPTTIATAPVVLIFSVIRWSRPLSLVRRSRWRFVAAILISLSQIAGWVALIAALIVQLAPRKA